MKRELLNFIAAVGFVLLGGALVLIVLVTTLFIFPDLTIFGAKAVKERDTQIVYRDPGLTEAFANGKFIIESTGTQIEVKMSNAGYEGAGTIVVNESASGIAFNSLSRTLVEWRQTLYNDEVYYRIKILEPSGMVFKDKPTTVTINLPHRAKSDEFLHDFVLENNYSTVNFSFVDNTVGQVDALKIDELVVKSATNVNIPANENISLNKVEIKSNKTKFVCHSNVLGDVNVTGSYGAQTFNCKIGGSVNVAGNYNNFRGDEAGDVTYKNKKGYLALNEIGKLNVETVDAKVSIGTVNNGITMTTTNGNLSVSEVTNGGLDFTVGGITQPNAKANVAVDSIVGDVLVRNYGLGSIQLLGIVGNVDVKSSEVGAGKIRIGFSDEANNCSVKVLGYDGNIVVTGINGQADITVRNWENGAGAANIEAQFNKVVGTENVIKAGGYLSGHHDWGNVDIKVDNDCNNFDLFVYGANSANSSAKYGFKEENMYIIGEGEQAKSNKITVSQDGSSSGAVSVYTKQRFYLS